MKYIKINSFTPNPMLSSRMLLQLSDSSTASLWPGMQMHTYARTYACTHTHTHAHTHTHTHAHTRTHRLSFVTLCSKGAGLLRITSQMKLKLMRPNSHEDHLNLGKLKKKMLEPRWKRGTFLTALPYPGFFTPL